MRHLVYISWVALATSIALFAFVFLQAGAIRTSAAERAEALVDQERQSDRGAHAQRVAAILAETAAEREALDEFVRHDVIDVVELLEAAGARAGIAVTVTGANTETGGIQEGEETLRPVTFAVNASGSYAALVHAVELYERLPLALQIEQLHLDRDQSGNESRWNLSLRLRILTLGTSL